MTLPLTGDLSITAINTQLGKLPEASIGFDDADARSLAAVPAGQISVADFYGKPAVAASTLYIGISSQAVATQATILALPSQIYTAYPLNFSLTSGSGMYQYFASPASLGMLEFFDRSSLFTGGWDGANNNMNIYGPMLLQINSIQYYVFRSDFPNLGYCAWTASLAV